MKLSNKILIAAFSLVLILTFITMLKVKSIHKEYLKDQTLGNKNWVSMEMKLQEFNELQVGNHFEVNWHRGAPNLKIQIEENLKPFLKVDQVNNKVTIHFDSSSTYRINGSIKIDVYSQTLEKIYLKDFVQFTSIDTIDSPEIYFEMEDHGEGSVLIKSDKLDLKLYDFSNLYARGSVENAFVNISDHTDFDGGKLSITNAQMIMSDFTHAYVMIQKYLKADCTDHSQLEYRGDSLVAEINKRDFSEVSEVK